MGKEYNCNIICNIFDYISFETTEALVNDNFNFDKFETEMGWFKIWGKRLCLDKITEERLLKSLQKDVIFFPALKVKDIVNYIHQNTNYRIDYGFTRTDDGEKHYIGLIQLKKKNEKGDEKEITLKMMYGNKSPKEAIKSALEEFLLKNKPIIT